MQPSSQDPINTTGQPSPSFSSDPPSQFRPDTVYSASNPYERSSYTQPASPPPPPENYPPYGDGGPATQQAARRDEKPRTSPQPPKRNGWKIVSLFLFILVLILGATTTASLLTHATSQQAPHATPVPTTAQSVLQATPTATQNSTGTTATPSAGATLTPAGPLTNYNAPQPGPSCDPNGGVWTPYPVGVISNIQCGTSIAIGASQTRGYLGLQLPGKTFASTNKIEVATTLPAIGDTQIDNCVGLVEQDANTGYLAELCNNGRWSLYSIGSSGAIIKTLSSNITAAQSNETLDLTFKGTTLTFTIAGDTQAHTVTLSSPLQPVTVGIAVYHTNANWGQTVDNFSYVTQF
jgi:hypothetical protein